MQIIIKTANIEKDVIDLVARNQLGYQDVIMSSENQPIPNPETTEQFVASYFQSLVNNKASEFYINIKREEELRKMSEEEALLSQRLKDEGSVQIIE